MSPQKVAAADRLAKALEMRKAGASYAMIATNLGYASESGAFNAVDRALQKYLLGTPHIVADSNLSYEVVGLRSRT